MNGQTVKGHFTQFVLGLALMLTIALGAVMLDRPQEAAASFDEEIMLEEACAEMQESYSTFYQLAEAAYHRGDNYWWTVYFHLAQGVSRSMGQMGC
jgi:hypothetical protein